MSEINKFQLMKAFKKKVENVFWPQVRGLRNTRNTLLCMWLLRITVTQVLVTPAASCLCSCLSLIWSTSTPIAGDKLGGLIFPVTFQPHLKMLFLCHTCPSSLLLLLKQDDSSLLQMPPLLGNLITTYPLYALQNWEVPSPAAAVLTHWLYNPRWEPALTF